MKALEKLREYANIDFGCDMSTHKEECLEAIAELEALHSRSCEGCKSFKNPKAKWECALGFRCRRAFRDRYEPKEQ